MSKYKLRFGDSLDSIDEYILKEWNLDYSFNKINPNYVTAHVILTEEQATFLKLKFPDIELAVGMFGSTAPETI